MAIADLQDEVEGRVLRPGDEGFAEAARPWNVAVQHEPDALLEAASAADVAAGVRWAAAQKLPIAAQSTGHGVTDAMYDGLLISTRLLKDVEVDIAARTARVGAGVQWKDLLPKIVPHGLIALNGSSSDVGIVGYILGGGLPVLGRAFGFAADFVRSIDVVTPDGRSRTVDAGHDADLFAVLKGGKGNFGVVTGLELDLIPLTDFYGGSIMYPGEDAEEVFTAFRAWVAGLPDDACPSIALLRLPPEEFIPEPIRGRFLVHLRFAYPGTAEEGDRLIAPMRHVSTPVMDMVGPLGYEQVDLVSMDPADPLPFENGGALLTDFDEDAQRALLDVAGPGKQFPALLVELRLLGGALGKPSPVLDAVSGRDAAWITQAVGVLAPPIAAMVPDAIAAFLEALRPWSTGRTLVNFHGRPGDAEDRARAWSPDAYDAITKAKRRYDPDNLMRFGHAVQLPSGEPAEAALPLL
ncbi:FAD-binding oxidoreductase [Amnibacterium sp. CER49]|uniref:FAD-binding oxidoreductase n=1 Tax=Amnibacterium sp. CER49 TaxID=3039161 RepID=UPI00244C46BE|nr:FAD-binding oxidoreductase [Amnibacterium sp. CER49]MDH2444549.1 FAD-binding oxidoreductase [Amnibacterium sp. CER49]